MWIKVLNGKPSLFLTKKLK